MGKLDSVSVMSSYSRTPLSFVIQQNKTFVLRCVVTVVLVKIIDDGGDGVIGDGSIDNNSGIKNNGDCIV